MSTLAGSGVPGWADGEGTSAIFKFPSGVSVDAEGAVFVADNDNNRIRKISSAGEELLGLWIWIVTGFVCADAIGWYQ